MTDPNTAQMAVGWVCDHQGLVTGLLAYLPIGVAASVASNYYDRLPKSVQVILHLIAANIGQAVVAAKAPAPAPQQQQPGVPGP